jgi:hypothetical protein
MNSSAFINEEKMSSYLIINQIFPAVSDEPKHPPPPNKKNPAMQSKDLILTKLS